ncbi:nucleotidyltransferase domain-containing protein [Algoriphagus persicinus]|uniref:nucleotidyltransferase domain-containing protein n=1 Tax=Algoriphagus persicinus TaxID=3108754 RepID=UPI002B3CAACE|nr:nucleotidyltransferase domain-containing protein [Algoriphagus sp. E1-3-M2]MEB2786872.1 nucleotidyltransferase domain-containing protein [Algoriphagus sp. E1-3-M2]
MKFGISNSAQKILIDIFKKYPQVAHVLVYGSRAKGTHNNRSDLDLVITDREIDRFTLGELLSDINESDFPYTIDLQRLSRIKNENLIDHIQRVGKTFYRRDKV